MIRLVVAATTVLVLVSLAPSVVLAHAELVTSDPADKAELATPPTVVTLTFSEDLDPSKSLFKLLGPDGSTIGSGSVTGARVMTLGDLSLAPGSYLIEWTSASAQDGDIARGKLSFTVLAAASSAAPSAAPSTSASPGASASPSAAPSAAPATPTPQATPAPVASADTQPAASSGTDVLLPIVAGLIVVAGVGFFVLRRSRGA